MPKRKPSKKKSSPLFSLNAKVFLALASIVIAIGVLYLGSKDQRILQVPQDASHTVPDSLHAAHISSGKIAFVKNGNIWIAGSKGRAYPVTHDATDKISENYPRPLKYRTPVWSPDGKYLAFVQVIDNTEEAHILIYDGGKIIQNTPSDNVYYNSIPVWLSPTQILSDGGFEAQDRDWTTFQFNFFDSTIEDTGLYGGLFRSVTSDRATDGCGGGGRPEWSYKLSYNHNGGMDGIRRTFLYLPQNKTILNSIGCEEETVYISTESDPNFSLFSKKNPPDGSIWNLNSSPHEITASEKKDMLAGTINQNIVLLDLEGNITKTLTTSGKAYAPVFSPDGSMIYYTDGLGDIPVLKKIRTDGTDETVVFNGNKIGAISNITFSPDGKTIAFTLITQITPQDPDNGDWTGKAKEDIYIIDTDGSNQKILIDDASQSVWK